MFRFIRRHWLAYLIGFVLAVAIGAAGAVFIGERFSTPEDVRQARVAAEKKDASLADAEGSASDSGAAATGSAAVSVDTGSSGE